MHPTGVSCPRSCHSSRVRSVKMDWSNHSRPNTSGTATSFTMTAQWVQIESELTMWNSGELENLLNMQPSRTKSARLASSTTGPEPNGECKHPCTYVPRSRSRSLFLVHLRVIYLKQPFSTFELNLSDSTFFIFYCLYNFVWTLFEHAVRNSLFITKQKTSFGQKIQKEG